MTREFKSLFLNASFFGTVASALSMAATVITAKFFGAEAYVNFTVDLAALGLLLLFIDVVPPSYAVFKTQDDPMWFGPIAVLQAGATSIVIAAVALAGRHTTVFNDYSSWMLLYVASSSGKKFLDLRLQATGRLPEYFATEAIAAAFRLVFMALAIFFGFVDQDALWFALAGSMIVAQFGYWGRNKDDLKIFSSATSKECWREVARSRADFPNYYIGSAVKRVKDSATTLLSEIYFTSTSSLAYFLMSYRGALFAAGQIRIFEAILNHRKALVIADGISDKDKYKAILIGQVTSIIASLALVTTSGVSGAFSLTIVIASFALWPISLIAFTRAKAYSQYRVATVNASMLLSVTSLAGMALILTEIHPDSAALFCILIFFAESVGYWYLKRGSGNK